MIQFFKMPARPSAHYVVPLVLSLLISACGGGSGSSTSGSSSNSGGSGSTGVSLAAGYQQALAASPSFTSTGPTAGTVFALTQSSLAATVTPGDAYATVTADTATDTSLPANPHKFYRVIAGQ